MSDGIMTTTRYNSLEFFADYLFFKHKTNQKNYDDNNKQYKQHNDRSKKNHH